jgi:hypothetical protein
MIIKLISKIANMISSSINNPSKKIHLIIPTNSILITVQLNPLKKNLIKDSLINLLILNKTLLLKKYFLYHLKFNQLVNHLIKKAQMI